MPGRPHHILFISSWYPNRNNPTHGIFNRAFAEAAALCNTVSVLHVCSDEHLTQEFELVESTEKNIRTVIVYYKKITSAFPGLSALQKRKQLLRGFEMGYRHLFSTGSRPGLIQLNVVMPAGIGAKHLSQSYGIPYIINEGWSGYCPADGSYKGLLMKYFTKKIIAGAQRIMPVSKDLETCMQAHGLKGNYTIVPNVVNTELFRPMPAEPHSGTRFIHISALDDSQKNVSGIIRAFKQALIKQSDLTLQIVGEGDGRAGLQQLVKDLQLHHAVSFTGRLMGQAIVQAIHQSDALVMFSNYETFCLTIAEALACGKPVITSRAGGLTDHIGPELGITIAKKDEAGLSEAFLKFSSIKSSYDPEVLRRFITEHYTVEKVGKLLTEVYNDV